MFKNIIAAATVAVALFSINDIALAQSGGGESDDEEVMVTAWVSVPLRIDRLRDLDLGRIRRGDNRTVSADDAGAGEIVVNGDASEDIHLMYPQAPATVTLNHTDQNDGATLQVSLLCKTSLTQGSGGTAYNSGRAVQLSNDGNGNGVMDGDGQRYFRFGGSVTTANQQARGTYQGSFQVTADYHP